MTPGVCVEAFFSGGAFRFAPVLSGLVPDYNVNTAAIAAGWDGVRPLIARITVSAGCVVYGTVNTAGAAAMWVPNTFPANSSITIVRIGAIIGRGGVGTGEAGRDGLRLQYPTRLEGVGLIGSGGGAGGEGQTMTVSSSPNTPIVQLTGSGGNPGFGAGLSGNLAGSAGVNGSTSSGSSTTVTGGKGGDGGGPGQPGLGGANATGTGTFVSSSGPYAGGTPGTAIVGMEYATFVGGDAGEIAGPVTYGANSYIATPTATPGSFGAVFEGGYYGGLLWQSIAASLTSRTITSTSQVVTVAVPAMVGNPMVYSGQSIKLVSLSNPTRYMQGTVAGAANGNLTINVTNQSGGGNTHNDWVVMSRFRQIFAPKATGETTLAVAVGVLPDEAWNLHEPTVVGDAMRAAGDATAFPLAHWAKGLNIGSRTDWEVPTRDVLELAQRNLKASTTNNYVTADRPASPSKSYAVLGSQNDVSASQGINTNTALIGTAYTTTSPARTSPALFQLPSGAQAFDSVVYGSSTAYDANSIWVQSLDTATTYGRQYTAPKATPVRVRAVRRSII